MWTPGMDVSRDPRGRAELDERVRRLGWDDDTDVAYGSVKRRTVAAWLDSSGLIEGEMRRLYPDAGQCRRMIEYVRVKMFEKITGIPVTSHSAQWNWNNLWDPRADTSFCAWARRLSYTIAQWNAKRVLHPRERQPIEPDEDEEGRGDELERTPAPGMDADPFILSPNLQVPRPVGPDRGRLLRRFDQTLHEQDADTAVETIIGLMRAQGWWDRSLDALPGVQAVGLMLTPMRANLKPLFERLPDMQAMCDTEDTRRLASLYADSQTGRRGGGALLLNAIRARARHDHTLEWEVIRRLGTQCARLIHV